MFTPSDRIHGGPCDEEMHAFGVDPDEVLDFSVNTNPYGPCQTVIDAVRTAPIERYPDPTARAARERLSIALGVSADDIALGNGAAELLWTIARVLLRPHATAFIVEPTFSEFRAAAMATGARVREWKATKRDSFALDLSSIASAVETSKAEVAYLCVPNTPTGAGLSASHIADWANAVPHVFVILDQSFLSLSEHHDDASVPMPSNVICVRSITKEHTIPGVRLGYLIAVQEVIARLETHRPVWTTSSIAQAAAVAACGEYAFVEESRRKILLDRERLSGGIARLGHRVYGSTTGFFLVDVGNAAQLRRSLLARHRILVRDCASFGLPELIRIAARPPAECERFIGALAEESQLCRRS